LRAEPEIVWRVANPFRFFLDPADTAVHRSTYLSLTDEEREKRPVRAAERKLEESHGDGWSATMVAKTCWDRDNNRYSCGERGDYLAPKSHTILAEMVGLEDAQTVDCLWLTAPQKSGPRGKALALPCDTPVALEVPYPGGAWITVEIGGRQVAETAVRVSDLFIVGMGDSFASGEGNPDVPVRFSPERSADYGAALTGYPARVGAWHTIGDETFIAENARWLDQACHRSLYSHQLRAALELAIEDPHRAVTFVGVACSGADTVFGLFLRYGGHEWVPNPPPLSQLSSVAEAQCGSKQAPLHDLPEAYHMRGRVPELKGGLVLKKCDADRARRIDLIFLSLGGNDIGFARLVANAVLSDGSTLRRLSGWFGQVHGAVEAERLLEGLKERFKSANRAFHNILHVPWTESDRVVLLAYPPMATQEDGSSLCPDGQAGMNVLPDFALSQVKAREGAAVAERLNVVMRESAQFNHWTFVEAHRREFRGRGICAGFTDAPYNMADEMRVPRNLNGTWEPYNPNEWRAYTERQRWFRTPNDAFMTGNFHVPQSLLQRVLKAQGLAWVQLLLASTYSGAFHPTAEGQAAMADALVEASRRVLRGYETRRSAATLERPEASGAGER
jgi:hypothetical protein